MIQPGRGGREPFEECGVGDQRLCVEGGVRDELCGGEHDRGLPLDLLDPLHGACDVERGGPGQVVRLCRQVSYRQGREGGPGDLALEEPGRRGAGRLGAEQPGEGVLLGPVLVMLRVPPYLMCAKQNEMGQKKVCVVSASWLIYLGFG